ncbi:hypothetical protein M0L20_13705 [Spirosoma sp. RP8]|uniref:Uncharacterized protein n=1 Tax=Spirosoma liriopis TaxID=2937440 RepID=A0ABT0HLA2_9BACT|nr:hypothetical protein [Spirosoma liriopis]MCK8492918.1 hypothetical protein [Spirosoma liriopis]
MQTIQKSISPEAVTGFNRIAYHESFVILRDLNMVQQVRIVTVNDTGKPITELIEQDASLSAVQKQNALARYQEQIVTRQTAGAFVDTATGKVVTTPGEGVITQRDYFQAVTLGDLKKMGLTINDKTPVAQLLYALMGNEISNSDARGDL